MLSLVAAVLVDPWYRSARAETGGEGRCIWVAPCLLDEEMRRSNSCIDWQRRGIRPTWRMVELGRRRSLPTRRKMGYIEASRRSWRALLHKREASFSGAPWWHTRVCISGVLP